MIDWPWGFGLGTAVIFGAALLPFATAAATNGQGPMEAQVAQMDEQSRHAGMVKLPEKGPKIIGRQVQELSHDYQPASIAWSHSGRTLVTSMQADAAIQLWDIGTRGLLHKLRKTTGGPTPISLFTPDDRYIVTASAIKSPLAPQTAVSILAADTFEVLKNLDGPYHDHGHSNAPMAIALNADGTLLAVAHAGNAWDSVVSIYETGNWTLQKVLDPPLKGKVVEALKFDPRNENLAIATLQGIVEIWNVPTATRIASFQAHYGYVNDIAYSPDGKTLVTAASISNTVPDPQKNALYHSGDTELIRAWDSDSAALIRSYDGDFGAVRSIGFSADGRYLLTMCEDHAIRIWDAKSADLIEAIDLGRMFPHAAVFSPDQTKLAYAIGNVVRIVDITAPAR
jgi:WD40 repeat protein